MMILKTAYRCFLRDNKGAFAAEAAFIVPVVLTLGFTAIDTSYLLLQNHKMEQALVTAGNYLAKSDQPTRFAARARLLAVTGDVSPGQTPIIKNWAPSDIRLQVRFINNSNGAYRGGRTVKVIKVSSEITYEGLGFINAFAGGRLTIKGDYEERLTAVNL